MNTRQTQAAADRLAAKLDALDLDDDERAVLVALCAAAATSVESDEGEVEGFAFGLGGPSGVPAGAAGAPITVSLRKSGGGGNKSGESFLRFELHEVFISS